MLSLTTRQIQILKLIVEEFIGTAEPVGSENLDKKYNLGVSPATIRNEMVALTKQGYLTKAHTSAGRLPTSLALKLYVNELMKEKELTVADEVSVKEKIWESRHNPEELIDELTKILAERTKSLGLSLGESDQHLHHAGYANLLDMPEFYDIRVMRDVLSLIEEAGVLNEIFRYGESENTVRVVYGQELGNKNLDPVGLIFTDIIIGPRKYHLAAIGSSRFDYPYVVPMMRYFKKLVEELTDA